MSNKRQKIKMPLKKEKLNEKKNGRDILRTATDNLDVSAIIKEILDMEIADAQREIDRDRDREGLTTSQIAVLDVDPRINFASVTTNTTGDLFVHGF